MLSLRILGRLAPKSAIRTSSFRTITSLSRNSLVRPSSQPLKKASFPAFSTSISRREAAGESDQVLSEKLNQERSLEVESNDTTRLPEDIQDFLDNSSWRLLDEPGTDEVTITKEFGNEKIEVSFSINDMTEQDDDAEELDDEDAALSDEDFDELQPKKTINQSGTKGGKIDVMPEDSIAPADRDLPADGAMDTPVYPLALRINITKPGDKTIEIVAVVEDGSIEIDNISYGSSDNDGAEKKYAGPPMTSLDPDLQAMFEQYLEERGIDATISQFAFSYNDYKEQREYVAWLKKMKEFVDA